MAMLANYASIDGDGLLHVNGGVWEYVERPQFPCMISSYPCSVWSVRGVDLCLRRVP